MKKLIIILFILLNTVGFSQSVRNSILGLYSGTYWEYSTGQPVVNAGVKLIAHPTDTSGFILIDTLNNVIDTLQAFLSTDGSSGAVIDTFIWNYSQACGDIIPAQDSIIYVSFSPPNALSSVGSFRLKCTTHFYPTSVHVIGDIRVRIYPNPALDILYLEMDKIPQNQYIIFNSMGQQVILGNINYDSPSISIANFPAGVYYIKFKNKQQETNKCFIKY